MNSERPETGEWVNLGLPQETQVTVRGLALSGDLVVAAVIAQAGGAAGPREALILAADAAGVSQWRALYRRPLPSDWVEIDGQRRRLTIAQGFYGFTSWPTPVPAPGAVVTALVSIQGSALIEVDGAHDVREHPNRSPEAGVPPLGPLLSVGDRLIALPAGAPVPAGHRGPANGSARAYQCSDPASGPWLPLCPAESEAVPPFSSLAFAGGRLFAVAADATAGFALWCADLRGGAAPAWAPIVAQGAFRFTLNAGVSAITAHEDGAVYLATIAAGDVAGPGHAGPEILRIDPDGRWEIIVGDPRFTPDGLKRPVSGLAAGFGDRRPAAITGLLSRPDGLLAIHQSRVATGTIGGHGRYAGPATIWTSVNGTDWAMAGTAEVPDLGEIRAAVVTPRGLLLGGSGVARPGGTGTHASDANPAAAPGAVVLLPGVTGPRSC